jgi:type IV secretion system protein VirB9
MYRRLIAMIVMLCISWVSLGEIPIATDNRMKTYVYNQNDVYLVTVSTGFQSSIEFEQGETVQTLSLGESYAWNITPIDNRLIIKPLENNVRTNMMVITNRRTYQFDIVSTSDEDAAISYVVRFYYPKSRLR